MNLTKRIGSHTCEICNYHDLLIVDLLGLRCKKCGNVLFTKESKMYRKIIRPKRVITKPKIREIKQVQKIRISKWLKDLYIIGQ